MLDVIPDWYINAKYVATNGKLAANNAKPETNKKLTPNIFDIRLVRMRDELPSQYPNDINPKNAPIMILVITGLDPTQNAN